MKIGRMSIYSDKSSNSLHDEAPPNTDRKPIVIGLYGVPGCGKTYLLNQLKEELGNEQFAFFEGLEMIDSVAPGGLDGFKVLTENFKSAWREIAMGEIRRQCEACGKVGIVTGHFMFWPQGAEAGNPVCTQRDLDIYTHILYLDVPASVVFERCRNDEARRRDPSVSANHIFRWQQEEKAQLRRLCLDHGILFRLINPGLRFYPTLVALLHDSRNHTDTYNLARAESKLDEMLDKQSQVNMVLIMDADRTIAAEDTGSLFWNRVAESRQPRDAEYPLKALFGSHLGYSYTGFRQATLLYGEVTEDHEFENICRDVASRVAIYPEFLSLLRLVADYEQIGVVVVSCGLRLVWEKVLEREGLSEKVKVIGGGLVSDGCVVTPAVKGALTKRLRETHKKYVWAFGDSPLDLDMLRMANQAIVVVGKEAARSRSMDEPLLSAIDNEGLRARQVLLPSSVSPRLDTFKLPIVQLTDGEIVNSILNSRSRRTLQVLHATHKPAAKLLTTPTRDANIAGPALQQAHRRVGWYLATEFLTDVIGLEDYPIPHVQGHQTTGHRLSHESQTTIVALVRGGVALAEGVNEVFPLATFVHANGPEDVKFHHLQGRITVMIVDSVLNSGKTALEFVRRVHSLHATIRVVVVVGVAQTDAVSEGYFASELPRTARVSVVALRVSDNKFTGSGGTDTGNRLFNTTHLA